MSTKIQHKLLIIAIKITALMIITAVNADDSDNLQPIHDAHIHYDSDVWDALSPAEAIEMLNEENIQRALVSATPTEGAEKLYRQDPDIVIPMLRPYKNSRHRYQWFKDTELKNYLLKHLKRAPYRGFGEFHVFSEDANTKPIEQMVELARERNLVLHPHTNLEGMRILLAKAHDIPVLWAHGGFDVPVETLRKLMKKYPKLIIELSLRDGIVNEENKLTDVWKTFLTNNRTRFLTGMDTYKPSRWADLPEIADATRHWLNQLPKGVAEDIARNNLDRLFPRLKNE